MAIEVRYCRHCGRKTPHSVNKCNHILHFLITILFCGAWLPIWMLVAIFSGSSYCNVCQGGE